MSEWRDISSAPRDESPFLAYGKYQYPGDLSVTEYFEVARYSGDDEWPWEDGEGQHREGFFSHWQPLPAAPTAPASR